ncbi:hypothetical protein BJP40_14110 [Streptomyces sp. CC53]|uniref:hypothetical protein n=1 Tax=unclassified Streptomyces TaxID=2593676 RepID=UPI0008DDCD59|nr:MULTISPECIES: hypothetical protein [unclassified Streptomyces]OII66196.1 hypothetical protein BJP40_14110 [Streptomyces sp. CC53]
MSPKSPVQRGGPGRGRFEQLAQAASDFTSSPTFFLVCLGFIGFFAGVHVAHLDTHWLLLAAGCMTAVNLLLLALLKNSELRAEHALQRKLDAIAAALLEHYEEVAALQGGEPPKGRAFRELRQAIRLEEEI